MEEAVGSSVLGPLTALSSSWPQRPLRPKLLLVYLRPRGCLGSEAGRQHSQGLFHSLKWGLSTVAAASQRWPSFLVPGHCPFQT